MYFFTKIMNLEIKPMENGKFMKTLYSVQRAAQFLLWITSKSSPFLRFFRELGCFTLMVKFCLLSRQCKIKIFRWLEVYACKVDWSSELEKRFTVSDQKWGEILQKNTVNAWYKMLVVLQKSTVIVSIIYGYSAYSRKLS